MRREIEATRAELRQNIFELPQETAESAAQMRRVVVDQIEALAELNRIVARHGRNLDTVEPSARRADPVDATPPRRESTWRTAARAPSPLASRGDLGRAWTVDAAGTSSPHLRAARTPAPRAAAKPSAAAGSPTCSPARLREITMRHRAKQRDAS